MRLSALGDVCLMVPLVRTLQRTLGLTVFMVTHDLDSLHTACDRIAVLGDGKIIAAGTLYSNGQSTQASNPSL